MPRRAFRSFATIPVVLLLIVLITAVTAPAASALAPVAGGPTNPAEGGDSPTGSGSAPVDQTGGNASQAGDANAGQGDAPGLPAGGSAEAGPGPADPAVPADATEGYYIKVSLSEQTVTVYLDGQEIRSMICSAGVEEKPTPRGRFYIQNRGEFFFSEKYQQGGKWWVSFKDWGIYLFHSVPTDRDGNILAEEAAKLGQPASHGCVRLAVEDARWIYDTIPEGAPVDID